MKRPNLSATPLLDVRPVIVAGAALLVVGLGLSVFSVAGFVTARGQEEVLKGKLAELDSRRAILVAEVGSLDRRLSQVNWKALASEVKVFEDVVSQRHLVWSELLADLERVAPRQVRLVSITPSVKDEKVLVSLIGSAASRDAWLELLTVFLDDPRFTNPVPQSEEVSTGSPGSGYKFQLIVEYLPRGSA